MNKTKDIVLVAILATILFAQEQVLLFLPSVQLTFFLIILFSKALGLKRASLIVIIYVFLDNMFMASFNMVYTPFMLVGWLIIPISLNTIFKEVNDSFNLALLAILFSLLYCWIYIIPATIIMDMPFIPYLMADIPFEIIMCISSFITTLWLYDPCIKVFKKLYQN